jgi:hypothetical protein
MRRCLIHKAALVIALFSVTAAQDPVCDEASGLCSVNPKFDPSKLLAHFPDIISGEDDTDEKMQIICPFMRMLRRTGVLPDKSILPQRYRVFKIVNVIHKNFGLGAITYTEALAVVSAIASGQLLRFATFPGRVNLDKLFNVHFNLAHECGLVSTCSQ